eukprot:TRINITY_DN66124_c0_g1_i1.p1 TRINITY_DN66124_c0_g1~~TRINITY_DN66124_c0_g1_i1.p1  ORF type:complete len:526 (-),score=108.08 TRINITY_DN66124_c0_g1_i1:56-1633(-)
MGGSVPEPGEEAACCVADIEQADFVALRLDTTDDATLSGKPSHLEELEDFFARQARLQAAPESRLPLRLGLCCAVWCDEQRLWELRSHEFGLWPGSNMEMPPEVLRARHQQAAAWKAPDGQGLSTSRWAAQLACSVRWVFTTLRAKRAPIIVHDGLPDLLQLCDKFTGDVPTGHLDFGRAWMEHFPVVFDTHLIAQEDMPCEKAPLANRQDQVANQLNEAVMTWRSMTEGGCGGLVDLHRQLLGASRPRSQQACSRFKEFGVYTHRASSGRNGLVIGSGDGYMARSAMEVAEIFLLLMGQILYTPTADDMVEEASKKRKITSESQSVVPSPSRSNRPGQGLAVIAFEGSGSCEAGATTAAALGSSEDRRSGTPPLQDKGIDAEARLGVVTPPKVSPGRSTPPKVAPAPAPAAVEELFGRKRPRTGSSEKAAESNAAIAALAQKLTSMTQASGLREASTSTADSPSDLQMRASSACRFFHNRVTAAGTPPGYLRLDTLLQVQLIKRLRKSREGAEGAKGDAQASRQ